MATEGHSSKYDVIDGSDGVLDHVLGDDFIEIFKQVAVSPPPYKKWPPEDYLPPELELQEPIPEPDPAPEKEPTEPELPEPESEPAPTIELNQTLPPQPIPEPVPESPSQDLAQELFGGVTSDEGSWDGGIGGDVFVPPLAEEPGNQAALLLGIIFAIVLMVIIVIAAFLFIRRGQEDILCRVLGICDEESEAIVAVEPTPQIIVPIITPVTIEITDTPLISGVDIQATTPAPPPTPIPTLEPTIPINIPFTDDFDLGYSRYWKVYDGEISVSDGRLIAVGESALIGIEGLIDEYLFEFDYGGDRLTVQLTPRLRFIATAYTDEYAGWEILENNNWVDFRPAEQIPPLGHFEFLKYRSGQAIANLNGYHFSSIQINEFYGDLSTLYITIPSGSWIDNVTIRP